MARFFIAFYNAIERQGICALPCFYETFVKGLAKAGNDVLVETTDIWDFRQINCPANIAKKIKDFNPDVCFLFNNCFYDISNLVDCPIVIYEVDSFLFYKNKEVLYRNPNRFYYFVPQTCSFDVLQNELHVDKNRICYVPFFSEVKAKKEQIINNICFCGSKFTDADKSILHKFMLLSPNESEILQFKKCLELTAKNPYVNISDLGKIVGPLSDNVRLIMSDPYVIGCLSDMYRIKVLSFISDLGLGLYGTENWLNDLAYDKLVLSYNPQKIFSLNDTQKLYNSHKLGININNIQAMTGFGWRVADIMASNACLVSEYKPDFEKLFPGINIPFFNSENEAYDLCKKLLENENMRLDIVAQCQESIDKNYRFKHILQKIEQFLAIKLTGKKENTDNNIIFLPTIKYEQKNIVKTRMKQIIYSFGLFIASLPFLHLINHGKIQIKLKEKINRYIQ